MINFILIAQFVVLFLNIVVFVYLMNENSIKYRRARVMLLICISIGIILNIGKVTWLTVLFSFTPFLSLININENGKFYRFIKRVGVILGAVSSGYKMYKDIIVPYLKKRKKRNKQLKK